MSIRNWLFDEFLTQDERLMRVQKIIDALDFYANSDEDDGGETAKNVLEELENYAD